jgi:LemA protein
MEISIFIIIGAIVALLGYAAILYKQLANLQHNISEAWSHVEAMLKQRHNKLPELVENCKHYMLYEQETLEQLLQAGDAVSTAREQGDIRALGMAEGLLRTGLNELFAVAEGYPELTANEAFQQLHSDISELESSIALRREFYNQSVNDNNARISHLPSSIIAGIFNLQAAEMLEFDAA